MYEIKRILIYTIVFIGLLYVSFASVEAAELPKSTVKYFATWENKVDVQMNAPAQDPGACGSTWVYRIDLDTDPGAQAKLATIMLAFSQKTEITLVLSGCSDSFPRITGIRVYE